VKTKRSQWNALAGREETAGRGRLAEERP